MRTSEYQLTVFTDLWYHELAILPKNAQLLRVSTTRHTQKKTCSVQMRRGNSVLINGPDLERLCCFLNYSPVPLGTLNPSNENVHASTTSWIPLIIGSQSMAVLRADPVPLLD